MKRALKKINYLFLILFITFTYLILAQDSVPYNPTEKISGTFGEIDSSTGLPKKFSEYKEKADEFRYSEQNKSYLAKEWTKILASNKFFGPFLFYSNKIFSIFNPLWKAIFGIEFSWSLAFFVGLGLWFIIVIFIYFPAKAMFDNRLFALITGLVVASLTGFSGFINKSVLFFTAFIKNLFILFISIIIIVLLVVLYKQLFKKLEKESEEEELERAKEKTKAFGKIAGKELEELGE